MIGFLHGRIAAKAAPCVTLDVGGVGYELDTPMSTFLQLPAVGQEVRLITHLSVREDAHVLYGFATEDERRLFRGLLKVSGVGPKIALGVLSGLSVQAFERCVVAEDITALTRVPGVGRKTAERLVIEMRDRIGQKQLAVGGAVNGEGSAQGEAFDALVALGYKPAEATRLLKAAGQSIGNGMDDRMDNGAPASHSTEELIRRALQGAVRE